MIFCKKNSKDLQKLLEKIEDHPTRVIIDDEADYATPNSKVNQSEKSRITAVASASIDKTHVLVDKGEMSFALFDFDTQTIEEITNQEIKPIQKIKALAELLGKNCLPGYLINYIESFCPLGDQSVAVHPPMSIGGYTDKDGEMDKATITRTKGFIGKSQMEVTKYPDAIHHINVF